MEAPERVCIGCGDTEELARLETCTICRKAFCPDCVHRAFGRKFCSHECAQAYWFAGEADDDEDEPPDE